jgi:nitrogenase subunit NifH
VISHSGNHLTIPANENIHEAIKTIGEKDKVVLEGVLVNIKGTYKGESVIWNTSLSRIGNRQWFL